MLKVLGRGLGSTLRRATAAVSSSTVSHSTTTSAAGGGDAATQEKISGLVGAAKVVVFMKGIPSAPKCGFSNAVVQILKMHNVNYEAHDVLEDESIRGGVKEFTKWPTVPQVFINGEFVGGCDILLQMHQSGELIEELKKAGITSALLDQQRNNT